MEKRPYFIFGDVVTVVLVGTLCSLACFALFDTDWNMFVAMILGMVLGMVLSFLISAIGLSWLFGAMEIMIPAMLTGMFAAMVVSMQATMHYLHAFGVIHTGIAIGLAVLIATYIYNAVLSGRTAK